jgi:hypothetical protein
MKNTIKHLLMSVIAAPTFSEISIWFNSSSERWKKIATNIDLTK